MACKANCGVRKQLSKERIALGVLRRLLQRVEGLNDPNMVDKEGKISMLQDEIDIYLASIEQLQTTIGNGCVACNN
jgi:hypothetical protein